MRVNLQVRREHVDCPGYHVDTLDLYAARARAAYVRQAAIELGLPDETIKRDIGHVLLRLETLQDELITQNGKPAETAPVLSAEDEREAMDLLRSPDLVRRIVLDMERCGVVGEANNLLAGYLAAISRKLDTPLAILIQFSSAAGKSSLMDAVLALVPPEERMQYSAMTGQSLFYLGETDMQHKILAIAMHRRGTIFDYELLYGGKGDGKHLCGLLDAAELERKDGYDGEPVGVERKSVGSRPGQGRPLVGGRSECLSSRTKPAAMRRAVRRGCRGCAVRAERTS